jgi:hypothetical protein
MEYVRQPTNRRCIGLEDAADNRAVREHVEIIIVPLAGGTTVGRSFQDQLGCWSDLIASFPNLVWTRRRYRQRGGARSMIVTSDYRACAR